jgi:hypothetical protein
MVPGVERLASPAMVVSCLALAVALGGVAVAGKGSKVATGDVDLVTHKVERGGLQGTGTLPDGGPTIKGKAKKGDLLGIQAQVDIQRLEGASTCFLILYVKAPGLPEGSDTVAFQDSPTPQTVFLGLTNNGTSGAYDAVRRTVPIAKDGKYRVSLEYSSGHAGTVCEFSKRNLWVEHIR